MTSSQTTETRLCKRCLINKSDLVVRSEALCNSCFTAYVRTKIIKRMPTLRAKNAYFDEPSLFLLPVSFGASSVSLIETLSTYQQYQEERKRRAGFRLHILHVLHAATTASEFSLKMFEALKAKYPQHTYSCISLSVVHLHDGLPIPVLEDASLNSEESIIESTQSTLLPMKKLFQSISTSTSRADVLSIFLTRAVIRFAKYIKCDGILWGHSTTRLAEHILSESAKGRGYALPWTATDGPTPFGVSFYFPSREVLKKEFIDFINLADPSLRDLVNDDSFVPSQAPVSSKLTTIDMLMKQYFESVEENYPSIVSNVVRTSGRLQPSTASLQRCRLCRLPVTEEQLGIGRWEGIQDTDGRDLDHNTGFCYGCSRSIPEAAVPLLPE